RIRFIESICPDHLCEGYGFISYEDETAICMPAGVAVLVTSEAKPEQ
ncbi:MAG: NusG domain II-containing protein, partial [Oscillospiraceae bacterium]|nr:NusG domain II-containing protein [Oscillospiraceae bacterium]